MEVSSTGEVVVSARIENLADLVRSDAGDISSDDVRAIEIEDALVDTGATMLSLPRKHISTLGLKRHRSRTAGWGLSQRDTTSPNPPAPARIPLGVSLVCSCLSLSRTGTLVVSS